MIKRLYEAVSAPMREVKDGLTLRKITDEVMTVVEKHPYDKTATEEENEKRLNEIELGLFKAKQRW